MVTVETCKRVLAYLFVLSPHLNLTSLNMNWLETSGFRVWNLRNLSVDYGYLKRINVFFIHFIIYPMKLLDRFHEY